jgi:hypothetical protein
MRDAFDPYDDPDDERDDEHDEPEDKVLLDQRKCVVRDKKSGKVRTYVQRKPRGLKRFAKTGIENYKKFGDDLPTINATSRLGRRYLEIAAAVIKDAGGSPRIAEVKLQLIRRFAACATLAEQIEVQAMNGDSFSPSEHLIYTSALVKIAKVLGTGRTPVEVQSLDQYLDNLANEQLKRGETIDGEARPLDIADGAEGAKEDVGDGV